MQNDWGSRLTRISCFLLIALLVSTLFVSCRAIGNAIGTGLLFLIKIALILVGLTAWLVFLFYDNTDQKVKMKRKKKFASRRRQEEENADVELTNTFRELSKVALYLSFFGLWLFLFSLSWLIGFAPKPVFIIAIVAQGVAFIVKRKTTLIRSAYIWLVSTTTLGSLLYIFGLLNTFSFAIPSLPLSITITSFSILAAAAVLVLIPALIVSKGGVFLERKRSISIYVMWLLLGIAAAGIMGGGFWWVLLGLTVGLIFASFLNILEPDFGVQFPLLLPIFGIGGAIFAWFYFSAFRLPLFGIAIINSLGRVAIAGAVAGVGLCYLLNLPVYYWLKARRRKIAAREAAKNERKREEREKKKREREEYERNRPIEEKLAELESKALKAYQTNSTELKEAKKEFTETVGRDNLDDRLKGYLMLGDDEFKPRFGDIFSNSGVYRAEAQVMYLQDIARGFAAKYRVSAAKAKLENDIYTANRKKAILFVERLKDIYDKLTAKQKKRKIDDAAQAYNIGGLNVKIPDTIRSVSKLAVEFSNDRREALGTYFRSYDKFKRETNLSDGASALTFLGVMAIGGLLSKYEDIKELKQRLYRAQKRLFNKIKTLEGGRLQADAFSKRAGELNRALEKTMDAYGKMFVEIYGALYPAGDSTKTKEAREENKQNGGSYFSEEEAEAVVQLRTTGQFLLNLVDTEFEGESDE